MEKPQPETSLVPIFLTLESQVDGASSSRSPSEANGLPSKTLPALGAPQVSALVLMHAAPSLGRLPALGALLPENTATVCLQQETPVSLGTPYPLPPEEEGNIQAKKAGWLTLSC